MRWPWRRAQAGPIEPRRASISSNGKAMELQAAMEILAEVFGTRPGEVEEMIQRRLEERSWAEEDGRWLATLFIREYDLYQIIKLIQIVMRSLFEDYYVCEKCRLSEHSISGNSCSD